MISKISLYRYNLFIIYPIYGSALEYLKTKVVEFPYNGLF